MKLKPARLKPGMPVGKAVQATLRGTLRHLALNVPAVLDHGAPDAIHQARVAGRRTRAAIGVYRPVLDREEAKTIMRELKWLHGRLGPVRDLDVFRMDTLTPLIAALPDEKSLVRLQALAGAERDLACARACRALKSRRFARLAARADRFAAGNRGKGAPEVQAEAVPLFAARALDKAERKLSRAWRRACTSGGDEDFHRARIEAKKLHYAGLFFAGAFPGGKAGRFIKAVSGLQDTLGLAQDTVAGKALVTALARKGRGRLDRAAGLVTGFQSHRALEAAENLDAAWKAYGAATRFWKAE